MNLKQGDIIYITFDPADGHEIKKRRPALVMSRNEYNYSSQLAIICPITTTSKDRPFLIPLRQPVIDGVLKNGSKVNTLQIYSLDVGDDSHRNPEKIGHLNETEFLVIAQMMLEDFGLPF